MRESRLTENKPETLVMQSPEPTTDDKPTPRIQAKAIVALVAGIAPFVTAVTHYAYSVRTWEGSRVLEYFTRPHTWMGFLLFLIPGFLAVLLGHLALSAAKLRPEQYGGPCIATAGLTLGYVVIFETTINIWAARSFGIGLWCP